ncbi:MAG: lipid A export permease/ATP-binding protein MsbA [Gammaproteobacteria bacterium]|nr:lipid A export permease/ATP-binding protein MsbA [Gammaproteobacteria bacterium]
MTATPAETYRRLLRHVLPYKGRFALAIVGMVVLALTEPAVPALLQPLLDDSFVAKDPNSVTLVAALLVAVFVLRGLSAYLSALGLAWVAGRLVMDLRTQMFERLLTVPTRFIDAQSAGKLISKVTYDATQVMEAATHVVTVLIKDSLAVAGLLAWMAWINLELTLIAIVTAPCVALIVRHFSRRLRNMSRGLQDSMGDMTHVLNEVIEGQGVVRVFGGQPYERRRFRQVANAGRLFHLKFISAGAATGPIAQLIVAFALAAVIMVAAQQAVDETITIGGFASFFTAMAMVFSPLRRLTHVNSRLQRGVAAADSVFTLIDEAVERDSGTVRARSIAGHVEFKGVNFAYPHSDSLALEDVDLVIAPGETVALVGPSGSGKTTLTHLLPRFYEVDEGRVLLDGVDLRDYTLASLREQVALVSQDIVLFNDTVAANIAYGPMASASRNAVEAAAEQANAMDFIRNLPDGFDTDIGENGVRLSGGQRQRLAIARAFLKQAPVLIMDEATSALDNRSERRVQEALDALRAGRTTLIVAHRLTTVERADRIVVMSEGRVVEQGSHADLLAGNSLYAGLYRFQFARQANG